MENNSNIAPVLFSKGFFIVLTSLL